MTGDGYFFIATIHGMGDGGKDTLTNARLIAESPTLHDLLLTTIWVKKSDGQQYCHRCLAGRAEGHTADCELDAVFRRIGSETGTG